jgi:RNA polymerase sigma-70 factor, ECF subfamily
MTIDELNYFIIEYGKLLYVFYCNLCGDRMEADDLYQDTILKAVELRHRQEKGKDGAVYLSNLSCGIIYG